MTRPRSRTCLFLVLLTLLGLVLAWGSPARAEPGDLSPTWQQEIQEAESNLAGERAQLQEAQQELQEADADSIYAESRRERVADYESRVSAAQAQVTAAEAGLRKQNELDRAGEPQDQLREIRESIEYYETLGSEAQAAGDTATAELAEEELRGGVFGGGLYELQEKAEAERAAKEAASDALEETTAETTAETTDETTAAAPGGGDGGEKQDRPKPEPAPEKAPAGDEAGGDGPGIGGFLGALGITRPLPVLVFFALVAGGVFALAKSGGTSVREYFSLPKFGALMAQHKKKTKKQKKSPKPSKPTKAAATSQPPKPANLEDEPERRDEPRPEPGADDKPKDVTPEELDEMFGMGREPGEGDEEDADGNPPD